MDTIINNILELTKANEKRSEEISILARNRYSQEKMAKEYFELYKEVRANYESSGIN